MQKPSKLLLCPTCKTLPQAKRDSVISRALRSIASLERHVLKAHRLLEESPTCFESTAHRNPAPRNHSASTLLKTLIELLNRRSSWCQSSHHGESRNHRGHRHGRQSLRDHHHRGRHHHGHRIHHHHGHRIHHGHHRDRRQSRWSHGWGDGCWQSRV